MLPYPVDRKKDLSWKAISRLSEVGYPSRYGVVGRSNHETLDDEAGYIFLVKVLIYFIDIEETPADHGHDHKLALCK